MTPDQIAQIIILVITGLLGGGVSSAAITRVRGAADQRNFKQLADHYEGRYNEANEERLKQAKRIDELETHTAKQTIALTEVTARLTILKDEYQQQHTNDLATFGEYMKGQGRLEVQLESMQRELTELKTKFEAVKSENEQLRPLRELAEQQLTKITQLEQKNRELVAQLQIKEDQLRILRSRENPEPDPPNVLSRTGTDE